MENFDKRKIQNCVTQCKWIKYCLCPIYGSNHNVNKFNELNFKVYYIEFGESFVRFIEFIIVIIINSRARTRASSIAFYFNADVFIHFCWNCRLNGFFSRKQFREIYNRIHNFQFNSIQHFHHRLQYSTRILHTVIRNEIFNFFLILYFCLMLSV